MIYLQYISNYIYNILWIYYKYISNILIIYYEYITVILLIIVYEITAFWRHWMPVLVDRILREQFIIDIKRKEYIITSELNNIIN